MRPRKRATVIQGDREHIHHMLLARSWSQRLRGFFCIYGVCAFISDFRAYFSYVK